MKSIVKILAAGAMAFGAAACTSTETPEGPVETVNNIATYESTTAENSLSTFTYTATNGDLITLSAFYDAPEELKPGRRVLLTYTAEKYDVSGPITLYGVMALPGGAITANDTLPPYRELLGEVAAWRSGNYVNVTATITFQGHAEEIALYASKLDSVCPQLELVVVGSGDIAIDAAPRMLVASWDMTSIAGLADKDSVDVGFNDTWNIPRKINIKKPKY